MNFSHILLFVLMVGQEVKIVTFYEPTEENIQKCVSEASRLNGLLDEVRDHSDPDDSLDLISPYEPKLSWVSGSEVREALFDCTTVTVVE